MNDYRYMFKFLGDAQKLSEEEKIKISFLSNIIRNNLSKITDDVYLYKKAFEEKLIGLIKKEPNLLFVNYTYEHLYADIGENQKKVRERIDEPSLFTYLLYLNFTRKEDFGNAIFACLKNKKFRNSKLCGEYPIFEMLKWIDDSPSMNINKDFVFHPENVIVFDWINSLLEHDDSLFEQRDTLGRDIGMICAQSGYASQISCQNVILKFLNHNKASINQNNAGQTLGMYCAKYGFKEGFEIAKNHPKAKDLCDLTKNTIFDYKFKNEYDAILTDYDLNDLKYYREATEEEFHKI